MSTSPPEPRRTFSAPSISVEDTSYEEPLENLHTGTFLEFQHWRPSSTEQFQTTQRAPTVRSPNAKPRLNLHTTALAPNSSTEDEAPAPNGIRHGILTTGRMAEYWSSTTWAEVCQTTPSHNNPLAHTPRR